MRWPRLQAEPRLCLDAQGEGEGRGDQQDDPGDHQYCDFILLDANIDHKDDPGDH